MNLKDFYYELPNELIARFPLAQRSQSRLMCLNKNSNEIKHQYFNDLTVLLTPNDLLVFNDTKVIPARLFAHKQTGGKIEIFLERILNQHEILALVRASKTPQIGTQLILSNDQTVKVIGRENDFFHLQFQDTEDVLSLFNELGEIPLPPYLSREVAPLDKERYQTIYAKAYGAVAAPTAGLHFDEALLKNLSDKGVSFAHLTLHVGAGTFQPVRVEKIEEHQMHKEYCIINEAVCEKIKATKASGGRVIAVGTTTVRSLETAAKEGELKPFMGDTDIFIYPGKSFHCIDGMITNFHLPESTLLMLVSAFMGRERILDAYREAVKERYRFFSYGDAMLLV
ncbi:MAG: tRNA preQ1(34) S-adenosylmethionine ribosyltransferase-isomerase QueA [Gammaproteobacteria bacterium]